MTAAHQFTVLKGNFDNFFFEDDVDVELKIVPQPYHEELKYIREMLKENMILVRQSYLPIGEFDDGSGFTIDYILSADEEMMDLVLQLDFFYIDRAKEELKCVFRDIDGIDRKSVV